MKKFNVSVNDDADPTTRFLRHIAVVIAVVTLLGFLIPLTILRSIVAGIVGAYTFIDEDND